VALDVGIAQQHSLAPRLVGRRVRRRDQLRDLAWLLLDTAGVHTVAAQYVLQLIMRQGRDRPGVRPGHGAGGHHRVNDGFLNSLDHGFEQRVEGYAAQTLHRRRPGSAGRPVTVVGAACDDRADNGAEDRARGNACCLLAKGPRRDAVLANQGSRFRGSPNAIPAATNPPNSGSRNRVGSVRLQRQFPIKAVREDLANRAQR
jgi:hypothetical protein